MKLPVAPPVKPMLARSVPEVPVGMRYEPKWDGFRAIVFRDGDEVEITSRNTRPMARYFPELVEAARRLLPPRCVLDGEIVVARGLPPGPALPAGPELGAGEPATLDFEALQERIHPAASRIALLAERTPARFVAFDVLADGDSSLLDVPFERRREIAERMFADIGAPFHLTPATADRELALRWFDSFEGAGLDGLMAKPAGGVYEQDKRAMFKIKHERTADAVVAGYRPYKTDRDAVGSLLLGLYATTDASAPAGTPLASVGVVGAFPMARRRALVGELAELVVDMADHPWSPERAGAGTRGPWDAGESRWSAGRDLGFVPLRPERVVEVRYDHMEGDRLRHTAQFVRWRPDREPLSCTYGQLERPVGFDLAEILTAS